MTKESQNSDPRDSSPVEPPDTALDSDAPDSARPKTDSVDPAGHLAESPSAFASMTGQNHPELTPMGAFCIIAGALAVFNLVGVHMVLALKNEAFGGLYLGGLLAEFTVVGLWGVFGPQPLTIRWPVMLLATTLLGVCVLMGSNTSVGGLDQLGRGLLALPLVSLAAQVPMWAIRLLARVRLVGPLAEDNPHVQGPLRIQDLMLGTVLLATCLGLARFAIPDNRPADVWAMIGVPCAILAVAGLMILPALWACLTSVPPRSGAVAVFSYAAFMAGISIMAVMGLSPTSVPFQAIGVILGFGAGAGFVSVAGATHVSSRRNSIGTTVEREYGSRSLCDRLGRGIARLARESNKLKTCPTFSSVQFDLVVSFALRPPWPGRLLD